MRIRRAGWPPAQAPEPIRAPRSLLHADQHGRRCGTIRAGALRVSLVQRGRIGIRAAEGRDGDLITGTTVDAATGRTVEPADGSCARIALVALIALLTFG